MHTWFIGWGLVLLTAWAGYDARPTTHCITFDDRVRAQEAIERVYYEHRLWPKENPGPKPPFESMIGLAQIEAKVEDYLKKSVALDQYWHRPIQPEQLQAEMDRMAKQTQDPETLKELFAALDNDAYLIAECLARPVLADRLIYNWHAFDAGFHSEAKKMAERSLEELTPDNFATYPEGFCSRVKIALAAGRADEEREQGISSRDGTSTIYVDESEFKKIAARHPPASGSILIHEDASAFRIEYVRVQTRDFFEIEVRAFPKRAFGEWWGAESKEIDISSEVETIWAGAFALPSVMASTSASCQGDWQNSHLNDVPDPRHEHSAVWTGTEMIIWGGRYTEYGAEASDMKTGGRYSPATDSWVATSTGANCPIPRSKHTAVWTGTEMIVWGGKYYDGTTHYHNTGGRYDPSTDTWLPTSTGTNCPSGRHLHTAVWTGTEMIVYGGSDWYNYFKSGARYDPNSDSWTPTSTGQYCPSDRAAHSAVWTGTEMIVWGGWSGWNGTYLNSGGRYNPTSDSWVPTSIGTNCPNGRIAHTAVWTGSEMIVWGGYGGYGGPSYLNSGGRYSPSADSWTTTGGSNSPSARRDHSAVWTDTEMIVYGGHSAYGYLNTGARYSPSTSSWIALPLAPSDLLQRAEHTAVWTGEEMIIWGGLDYSYLHSDGARYAPATDSWVTTSSGLNFPKAREGHSALWTGAEMIVWGGESSRWGYLGTGGRYDPATDSWMPVSVGAGCPTERFRHTAVWTGMEMIIWGGYGVFNAPDGTHKNTGGRYSPNADSWIPTSISTNCPSGRDCHSAVWTGTEMIIWGGAEEVYPYHTNTGARYNPAADTWSITSTALNCPTRRIWHSAVWCGNEMIIWGGYDYSSLNSGGRYNPSKDTWKTTSSQEGCPSGRDLHTAIWTGTEMIVWGGWGYDIGAFRTGGRYDPIADKWTATPTWPDCPIARYFHTAVWTGEEMIIWGGEYNGDSQDHIALNSGGRYNPSMNLWMETSTNAFCPSPRQGHSAVWTGSQMIVWGGSAESLNWTSGGIYLPPAVPKPTIVGPAEGCYVTGVQLSTQSFSSYQWYFNDWPIWGSNLQFYTAKQSGTYSVSVNDPNGCPGFSPVISVSIYVAPPVSISGSYLNDCPNPHISLTAGQFSEYQWMYNDIDISGASSQTYEASVSGSYKVKVADGKGCFGESEEHPVIIQFCSTSEVSPSGAVYPLLLTKLTGSPQEIDLSFQKVEQTAGYGVYTGTIGSWYSHGGNPFGRTCDVPIVDFGTGQIHARIAMIPGNHYYLITAHNAIAEGPSGFDSSGMEITKMLSTCAP